MLKKVLAISLSTIIFITGCTDYRGAEPPTPAHPGPDQSNKDPIGTLEQGAEGTGQEAQGKLLTITVDQENTESMNVYLRDNQTYIPLIPILDFLGYETQEGRNGRTV